MTSENDDLALLAQLGAALAEADPVPPDVIESARASLAWRTVDAELAELVEDSTLTPMQGVRGPGEARQLTFQAHELTVAVELTQRSDGHQLLGQLAAPQPAHIEVRHPLTHATVEADDLGRFAVYRLPAGPVSLSCTVRGRRRIVTAWVSI
ncbi:MAG: hypothetical protein ACRDPK_06945 [Carbonactinosporaceae bacterium]